MIITPMVLLDLVSLYFDNTPSFRLTHLYAVRTIPGHAEVHALEIYPNLILSIFA